MQHTKLIPIYSDLTSAQSFYRAGLPLAELVHKYPLDLTNTKGINWFTAVHNDLFFYQMPTSKEHLKGAQIIQKCGKKIWVDYDDNTFALQKDNPAHDYWMENRVNEVIMGMCAIADVVSVSSEELARVYNKFREVSGKEPCVVIPNALWDYLVVKRSPAKAERSPLLLWRGGTSHSSNMQRFAEPIINCLLNNPEWKIQFLGAHPTWITDRLPKERWVTQEPMDLIDYFHYLDLLQPAITLIPLANTEFNRGRSHNGWLEATYAHSKVIAPDFNEWQKPGITNYANPEDFQFKLNDLMQPGVDLTGDVDQSWSVIQGNFLLSQVNELRWEIIRRLCPKKC